MRIPTLAATTLTAAALAVGILAAPVHAAPRAATSGASVVAPTREAVPAGIKCINLRTGIQRTLTGSTCPRGWVRTVPLATVAAKRKAFLRDARYLNSDLKLVSDSSLFYAGRLVCRTLDNGGDFDDIVDIMVVQADIDSEVVAVIMTAAIYDLCPGHRQFLQNWLNS